MRPIGPREFVVISRQLARDEFRRNRSAMWNVPSEVLDEESHNKHYGLDLRRMDESQLVGALYEAVSALAGLTPNDGRRAWWVQRRGRVMDEQRSRRPGRVA